MNEKKLLSSSKNLAARVNDLKIIERLIENIEYSRVTEDTFSLNKQSGTGVLDERGVKMIYIGKVRPAIMEPPIGKDILQFFKDYNPIRVEVPDDAEKQKELKTIVADGFISGEMVSLSRKNENVKSRDCLILDLDDVIVSREELIESIQSKMAKFEYILYPSISHGIKGVRYYYIWWRKKVP